MKWLGGLGINLTAANAVILHDMDFNPYNDKQVRFFVFLCVCDVCTLCWCLFCLYTLNRLVFKNFLNCFCSKNFENFWRNVLLGDYCVQLNWKLTFIYTYDPVWTAKRLPYAHSYQTKMMLRCLTGSVLDPFHLAGSGSVFWNGKMDPEWIRVAK